jgi:hypothetical protein
MYLEIYGSDGTRYFFAFNSIVCISADDVFVNVRYRDENLIVKNMSVKTPEKNYANDIVRYFYNKMRKKG